MGDSARRVTKDPARIERRRELTRTRSSSAAKNFHSRTYNCHSIILRLKVRKAPEIVFSITKNSNLLDSEREWHIVILVFSRQTQRRDTRTRGGPRTAPRGNSKEEAECLREALRTPGRKEVAEVGEGWESEGGFPGG